MLVSTDDPTSFPPTPGTDSNSAAKHGYPSQPWYDCYWGCGRDTRGLNTYGKVLMNVRARLRKEGL